MAHHTEEPSEEIIQRLTDQLKSAEERAFMEQTAKRLGLGETGRFPEGKLVEQDEGEIQYGIVDFKGKVVINFGKPTASIGMTPHQARAMAGLLRKHAKAIERKIG